MPASLHGEDKNLFPASQSPFNASQKHVFAREKTYFIHRWTRRNPQRFHNTPHFIVFYYCTSSSVVIYDHKLRTANFWLALKVFDFFKMKNIDLKAIDHP